MADEFTIARMIWIDQVYDDTGFVSHAVIEDGHVTRSETKLSAVARDIAFRLSRYFNRVHFSNTGVLHAWPSYQTLATQAGCSVKTVQRSIETLEQHGHLKKVGSGGRSRSLAYFAVVKHPSVAELNPEASIKSCAKGGHQCPPIEKGGHQSPPIEAVKVDSGVQKVDSGVRKGGHQSPTNLIEITLVKNSTDGISPRSHSPEAKPKPSIAVSPTKGGGAVAVIWRLMQGPGPLPPLDPITRKTMEPRWIMDHQAKHGWPGLNELSNQEWYSSFDKMAWEMQPVANSNTNNLWCAWRDEYRKRGWPMPEPKGDCACYPDGGPDALDGFIERLRRSVDDEAIKRAANVVPLRSA